VPILYVRPEGSTPGSDQLAVEEPLEIRLEGERVAVTMRTPVPGQDAELAVGFLIGESIVGKADVARVTECRFDQGDGGIADVSLRVGAAPRSGWQRAFYMTSSCGICGQESIEAIRKASPSVDDALEIEGSVLGHLPVTLRAAQPLFDRTGGLHAAALFARSGELVLLREDVGRHNAVDKLVGRSALDGLLPLQSCVLVVSGRASFEIIQKASMAGAPIVVAVSAPSSLAVRLARIVGITLVGFLRDGGFNVYSGRERIRGI
jgi:FdhD protein